MKLAEALMERSAMQTKLNSLRERIVRNALVQDGSAPHEDPQALLGEAHGIIDAMHELVARINATNAVTTMPNGGTLTQAIAERDKLKQRHALIGSAVEGSSKDPDRFRRSEVKWVSTVNVSSLMKQMDDLAGQIRRINVEIQEVNWNTQLIDV